MHNCLLGLRLHMLQSLKNLEHGLQKVVSKLKDGVH